MTVSPKRNLTTARSRRTTIDTANLGDCAPLIFMNERDMSDRGLGEFDLIDVASFWKDGSPRTVHGYRTVKSVIPPGCATGYMPELNVLCGIADVSTRSPSFPTSRPRHLA